MVRVVWAPNASRQYEMILSTITREAGESVGQKWRRKFNRAIGILKRFPKVGSPVEDVALDGYREQFVGPYRIIYRYFGSVCQIAIMVRAERDLNSHFPKVEPN